MAVAQAKLVLPRLKFSESTLQYHKPHSGPPIFYKPRFELPKETYEKTLGQPWLFEKDPLMPAYPYLKDKHRFPEANHGLYGSAEIQSGNKISKGRNKGKTLRKWFPNVKVENLRSQALKKTLTLPVTSRVKRTIEKCGGIDQYLLGNKPARIKELGLLGWKLRWHVMNSEMMKQKFAEQRLKAAIAHGKQPVDKDPFDETFAEAWRDPERRKKFINEQMENWENLREKDEKFQKHFSKILAAEKAPKTKVRTLPMVSAHSPATMSLPEDFEEEKDNRAERRRMMLNAGRESEARSQAEVDSDIVALKDLVLSETDATAPQATSKV